MFDQLTATPEQKEEIKLLLEANEQWMVADIAAILGRETRELVWCLPMADRKLLVLTGRIDEVDATGVDSGRPPERSKPILYRPDNWTSGYRKERGRR